MIKIHHLTIYHEVNFCLAMSSAAKVMTVLDERLIVLHTIYHEVCFLPRYVISYNGSDCVIWTVDSITYQCWEFTDNATVISCFPQRIQND